ncbi:uncharacterized protein LOC129919654 [Episyrphus balteatus]|uniref:uncharacterized protein LOC129919654 n=1 Tax=Episyrphus balteatus TaxID=286459 RepID=UPI002485687E|nr:uncharacterized protein LOC129919654 [Episyrphus balteatus]
MVYYCVNSILLCVIVIVGCKLASVSTTDVVTDNSTSSHDDPQEIQKAVCTVTAGEVRASAEAITTKTLQGVCGSAEMNLALRNLETKLYKELQEIKLLLKDIRYQKVGIVDTKVKPISTQEFLYTTKTPITTPETTTIPQPLEETTIILKKTKQPNLKSLITKNNPFKEKTFSYYWKLENFTEHINGSTGRVESPVFSIKGKPLRIKASFNHLRRDFLYLHLVYAVFENRDKFTNNIVLDTGGIFKHIDDKVLFNYKISILDQKNGSNDLVSQDFSTLDSGFPIPMSALLSPTYSKNNSLLIQISLYL